MNKDWVLYEMSDRTEIRKGLYFHGRTDNSSVGVSVRQQAGGHVPHSNHRPRLNDIGEREVKDWIPTNPY